jgi:hypothetical protein
LPKTEQQILTNNDYLLADILQKTLSFIDLSPSLYKALRVTVLG